MEKGPPNWRIFKYFRYEAQILETTERKMSNALLTIMILEKTIHESYDGVPFLN